MTDHASDVQRISATRVSGQAMESGEGIADPEIFRSLIKMGKHALVHGDVSRRTSWSARMALFSWTLSAPAEHVGSAKVRERRPIETRSTQDPIDGCALEQTRGRLHQTFRWFDTVLLQ